MIDDYFRERMQSKTGCAVILAGSGSDDEVKKGEKVSHIEKIVKGLEDFGILYEVRIKSAHKQPKGLMETIREYDKLNGSAVFVAVAGGTDALSGTGSFHVLSGPIVSCPPDAPNESCLRNPPGSSNSYISRPENVGKFIAQIYAPFNPEIREKLEDLNESKIRSLEEADRIVNKKYVDRQSRGRE